MNDVLAKTYDPSRALLFGLMQSCLLEWNTLGSCPLAQLPKTLSLDEKYHYAMELSEEEVHKILEHHEECSRKRITATLKD